VGGTSIRTVDSTKMIGSTAMMVAPWETGLWVAFLMIFDSSPWPPNASTSPTWIRSATLSKLVEIIVMAGPVAVGGPFRQCIVRLARLVHAPDQRRGFIVGLTMRGRAAMGKYKVSVRVRNTGTRRGSEVVQLYVGFPDSIDGPPNQLKGFAKVTLDPGKSRRVKLKLDPSTSPTGARRRTPGS
jgi:fibronectin type III domain protein